jgi:hypothetical protein
MSQRALEIPAMGFSLRKKTTINFGDICVEQTSSRSKFSKAKSKHTPQYPKQSSRSESIGKSSSPFSNYEKFQQQ